MTLNPLPQRGLRTISPDSPPTRSRAPSLVPAQRPVLYNLNPGEVTEWLMVPLSKSGLRFSGAWVRIPPSPRRGAGEADQARLERPCRESDRGFESHPLRFLHEMAAFLFAFQNRRDNITPDFESRLSFFHLPSF